MKTVILENDGLVRFLRLTEFEGLLEIIPSIGSPILFFPFVFVIFCYYYFFGGDIRI